MTRVLVPSIDSSLGLKLMPFVLSLIAGNVDVISFLGLGGLFTAHITGNLVILAAYIVGIGKAPVAQILSVPVFVIILGLTRLLVNGLQAIGLASLRPLLGLQFLLLISFLALSVTTNAHVDPNTISAIFAGMLGVSAMAVQNALVQLSLQGAPATAVMTTNITRFTLDLVTLLLNNNSDANTTTARSRAKHTWPAVVGFTIGCGLGAACEATMGLWSLALPSSLALLTLGLTIF